MRLAARLGGGDEVLLTADAGLGVAPACFVFAFAAAAFLKTFRSKELPEIHFNLLYDVANSGCSSEGEINTTLSLFTYF